MKKRLILLVVAIFTLCYIGISNMEFDTAIYLTYGGEERYKKIKIYAGSTYLFEKNQPQSHFNHTVENVQLKGGFRKIKVITDDGEFSDIVFIPLGRNLALEYINEKDKEPIFWIRQYYGLPVFE
jgi:hypothetical protein